MGPLVSTEWLAGELGKPDLVVLDATKFLPGQVGDGHQMFLEGHIPGARYFDVDAIADTEAGLPHMVPPVSRFARLVGELTGILSSRYFLDPRDDATMEQGGYARLDGRLTLESPNGRWAVDAIGKNLTSTTIIAYTLNLPVSLGSTLVQKQAPSNWALQARYKW